MRYMEPVDKVRELERWFAAKADRIANPPTGFTGGHGYPDPEIYAHVERLNRLSRLCTLQSCAGHRCTHALHCESCADWAVFSAGGGGEHIWSGQLWLWPDAKLGEWFLRNAPLLAVEPCIEKVGVLWHVEGREIIDIQFKGAGTGSLDASMAVICAFFERGNMKCNLS